MAVPRRPRPDEGSNVDQAPLTRWFIALRPADAARRALQTQGQRLAASCGGRVVPAERVHLTLAFIGNAPRALEPALRELVAALPLPDALVLDRLGSFDGRLLWLGPAETPLWLAASAQACRDALDRLVVPFDRKPFAAHLTLIRNARPTRGEALAALGRLISPIDLGASTWHPVESTNDGSGLHYRFV